MLVSGAWRHQASLLKHGEVVTEVMSDHSGYLLKPQFVQTMGVMGVSDDHFLVDRMFEVSEAQASKLW